MSVDQSRAASVLDRLERALSENDSATEVLTRWCADNDIGTGDPIRARSLVSGAGDVPGDVRTLLQVGEEEPVRFRHVSLECGDLVLSVARNWYVPGRLTADMNAALSASDIPFGPVVRPLGFTRERIKAWRGPAEGCPPDTVLTHRALLRLADGTPISLLVECYTGAMLPGAG